MARLSHTGGRWRKSSHSAVTNCVEVDHTGALVRVRDSKDPDGPHLVFSAEVWRGFTGDLKTGRLGRS